MALQRKAFILLLLLLPLGGLLSNQIQNENQLTFDDKAKLTALNNYVDFINESCHGLLIVVKLLENFNLDINKYVDLASYQINNYNNDDLPLDIFEDKDHWFYEITPYELYHEIEKSSQVLSRHSKMKPLADKMKSHLLSINTIRFDLENIIKDKDLSDTEDLNKVYAKLEEGVKLYDEFFNLQNQLEELIKEEAMDLVPNSGRYASLVAYMTEMYLSSKNLLLMIRKKETQGFEQFLLRNTRALKNLNAFSTNAFDEMQTNRYLFNWKNLRTASANINESFEAFMGEGAVSDQYLIYGRFYYYYNVNCISKFNRYGTGIVSSMNNVIKMLEIPVVRYTELPHYFKVIYPKKLEQVSFIESNEKFITSLPKELKARKVEAKNKSIRVTSDVVEFLFYDHMIQDGDVVSVNFNGEWIMEKEELEIAPKKFKIKLNKDGKNYLLLHADNVGLRPPNTIGVSYMMGGTKKEIILSSDLQVSELIELEIIE